MNWWEDQERVRAFLDHCYPWLVKEGENGERIYPVERSGEKRLTQMVGKGLVAPEDATKSNFIKWAPYINEEQVLSMLVEGFHWFGGPVVVDLAKREQLPLTARVIEHFLQHPLDDVRAWFARRKDFTPTKIQLERGLNDIDWTVRQAFAKREEIVLSEEQVMRGLNDEDNDVRIVFYERELEWRGKREKSVLKQTFSTIQEVKRRKTL